MSIRLGNGNWAVSASKLLAYNDAAGSFFNKEFDFTRATTATRINKSGLIEIVDNNIARIDFTGSSDGHLLLEPASTNLFDYSEDFSNWGSDNITLTPNSTTSPEGVNNATKLADNTSNGRHRLSIQDSFTSGSNYVMSVFVKKNSSGKFLLLNADAGFNQKAALNLDTLEITNIKGTNAKIENYQNGWYRFSVSGPATVTRSILTFIQIQNTAADESYVGNGDSFFIWGAQLEEQSFATSYIPTAGASVTRNRDEANNSGAAQDFNSLEGVLYAEILKKKDVNDNYILISLNNDASNSADNSVTLGFNNNNHFFLRVKSNGSDAFANQTIVANKNQFYKIALKYKSGDIACFIDGVEVATSTSSFSFSEILDNLSFDFDGDGTLQFLGQVRDLRVFIKALTDAELITLTT